MTNTEKIVARAHSGLTNYIVPGLESHMVHKARVFVNTRAQGAHITPHDHRFDLACLVLSGGVANTIFSQTGQPVGSGVDGYVASALEYTGEPGAYMAPVERFRSNFSRVQSVYTEGDWYFMQHNDFHTIEFTRDASVLILEGPTRKDFSRILEPIVAGERVPTFRVEPWMFQPIKI